MLDFDVSGEKSRASSGDLNLGHYAFLAQLICW
jgi:hypothetical protein